MGAELPGWACKAKHMGAELPGWVCKPKHVTPYFTIRITLSYGGLYGKCDSCGVTLRLAQNGLEQAKTALDTALDK